MQLLTIIDQFKEYFAGGFLMGIIGLVWAIIRKKGFALTIDGAAKFCTVFFSKLAKLFTFAAKTSDSIDKSIDDETGKLVKGNVKVAIEDMKDTANEAVNVFNTVKAQKKTE